MSQLSTPNLSVLDKIDPITPKVKGCGEKLVEVEFSMHIYNKNV